MDSLANTHERSIDVKPSAKNEQLEMDTGRVSWSVRRSGQGPVVLLLHGMGAAKHSWTTLSPLLESACTLIAPDLPGHGMEFDWNLLDNVRA